MRECAPEPVIAAPAEAFLPTVHNGRTVNQPGQPSSFAADFSAAQLCVTYLPSSAPTTYSPDPRKGHETSRTTEVYLHAYLTLKERAIQRTAPPGTTARRYRPPDRLLAFLEAL